MTISDDKLRLQVTIFQDEHPDLFQLLQSTKNTKRRSRLLQQLAAKQLSKQNQTTSPQLTTQETIPNDLQPKHQDSSTSNIRLHANLQDLGFNY